MDMKLAGKTALVTGSTAGIGLAIAQKLWEEGAQVIVNGRTAERVEAAISKIYDTPMDRPTRGITGVVADAAIDSGASAIISQFSSVDILINNVGVYESKAAFDLEDRDWLEMFRINVLSGARLTRHYLPRMLKANSGRVIFIASETGVNIPVDMIHYGVSKSAQIAMARGFAETTVGTAVTVNSVLPGPTKSEGVEVYLQHALADQAGHREQLEADFISKLRPTSLIGRFATSGEVAALVTYLSSPLASATNGASLRVEGGLLRQVL